MIKYKYEANFNSYFLRLKKYVNKLKAKKKKKVK